MKLQLHLLFLLFATALMGQDHATLISGALRADFGQGGKLQAPTGDHFLNLLVNDEYKPLIFDAGLMIAGENLNGFLEFHDLRGNTITPGIIGNTDPINAYWRVTAEEIEAHRADYADNGIIDNPIASIYAWPGRGNNFFEEYNGFTIDPGTSSIAGYWDQNFNALYEPSKGDFPILSLRGCLDQIYPPVTEMIFFPIMSTPAGATEPNIQIYLTAFRVGCEEPDNPISNAIFLHYKTIRVSSANFTPLNNTYYGFYADGDIGCSENDYMGTFPDRSTTYFYNATDLDNECLYPELSFGDNPPVLAIDIFRTSLNEFGTPNDIRSVVPIYNASDQTYPPATTDYNTPAEAYNYLKGLWKDGNALLDEGIGYSSGIPSAYAYPGDPLTGEGWSEVNSDNPNGDRRAIISSDPFTLLPGAINEFVIGVTYNDDPNLSNLEKISTLRDHVDLIQSMFDSCFEVNEFTSDFLGCSPLTTSLDEINTATPQLNMYPNPASSFLNIEFKGLDNGILQVYHSNGQLVMEKEVYNGIYELNIASWPKGVYLLQYKNGQSMVSQKLIIQ